MCVILIKSDRSKLQQQDKYLVSEHTPNDEDHKADTEVSQGCAAEKISALTTQEISVSTGARPSQKERG